MEPAAALTYEYNRDRLQYEGQFVTPEPIVAAVLPPSMENALVPCTAESTGPCDLIATSAEDIVGVWRQYLGGPRFETLLPERHGLHSLQCRRHFRDRRQYRKHRATFGGLTLLARSVLMAQSSSSVLRSTRRRPAISLPIISFAFMMYGDQPVALRYVTISDDCPGRSQDLTQAGIWVSGE